MTTYEPDNTGLSADRDSDNGPTLAREQCVLCSAPAGDDPVIFTGDRGTLLKVCRTCFTGSAFEQAGGGEGEYVDEIGEAAEPVRLFEALRMRRKEEESILEQVASTIGDMGRRLAEYEGETLRLEDRIRSLGAELERTRERLRRTESLLARVGQAGPPAEAGPLTETPPQTDTAPPTEAGPREEAARTASPGSEDEAAAAPSRAAPPATAHPGLETHLTVPQIRMAQRFFNESSFLAKTRGIRRSLGQPLVSLIPVAGQENRLLLTIAWEIVWYQFVIEANEAIPPEGRVTLFGEGMELDELSPEFRTANAALDNHGRLDASELEFSLLEDRGELIEESHPEDEQSIDDATEELWDQQNAPEFRWKD